jgi:hypothetical protein
MAVRFSDFIAARSAGTIDGSDVVAIKAGATVRVDGDDVATVAGVAAAYAPLNAGRSGTGFPEGVVTAPVGTVYRDTDATNGAVLWVKTIGSGNTGWVVAYGSTGWRDVTSLADTVNWETVTGDNPTKLRIARVGDTVTVTGTAQPTSTLSPILVAVLPEGFRPSGVAPTFNHGYFGTILDGGTGGGIGNMLVRADETALQARLFTSGSSLAAGTIGRIHITYPTINAWPATLPGSAA